MIVPTICFQAAVFYKPANLSSPKTLTLGFLVGVDPMESPASHTHCRKIDDSESETASIVAWCYQSSFMHLVHVRFRLMNMQPPSQNSAMFPAPDRIFSLLEARKGRYLRAIKTSFLDIHNAKWSRFIFVF